tara:strand:- start:40 stop:1641 length:1602 start_codon:yes stop_codon:yes gene_type:complete
MAVKYKPNYKGMLDGLENFDIHILKTFADIMGNHWLGVLTPETVKILWRFTKINGSQNYIFERFETNSTGAGMSQEILEKDFYGIPEKAQQALKHGVSIHGMGEKLAYAKLTKNCKEFRKEGVTVVTKTKENDKYLYAQFNMFDYDNEDDGYIIPTTPLTKDEALDLELPVDMIGNTGTYSRYTISPTDKDFYQNIQEYIANVFTSYLSTNKVTMTFELYQGGIICDETTLEHKIIPYDVGPSFTEPAFRGTLEYEGKHFPYDIGRRPMNKSSEFEEFQTLYPGRQALVGEHLTEAIAKNVCLIIIDKNTGYWYGVNKIPVTDKNLHRLVIRVYVEMKDIQTDTVKARCQFVKASGKTIDVAETHKVVLAAARTHYEKVNDTEDELREQLVRVLHGDIQIHPSIYKELCEALDIPEGYEWAKENITTNKAVLHKKLDIFVEGKEHVIEMKKTTPSGDEDFNQILAYSQLINPKRVTMLAVSNESGKHPKTFNSGFTKDSIAKFTNDLNTLETTKHISWNLVDLRYFDLHKLKK